MTRVSHCGCVFAVVPSLLVCLCSGVCEVRRAAIAVLHTLSGVVSSPYYPLVENLLKSSEEIIADPSYLKQVSQSILAVVNGICHLHYTYVV